MSPLKNKTPILLVRFVFGLFIFLSSSYFSQVASNQANQGYVPPNKDRRQQKATSSGSRGSNKSIDVISLAPTDHTPVTISANPNFLFLVKEKPDSLVYFSLVKPGVDRPIWQKELTIERSGILSVSIPQGINLDIDQEYVWNLKVVCNPRRPAENWYIRAVVKRIAPTAKLAQELASANSESEKAMVLANNGIWYDAISLSYYNKHESAGIAYFQQLLAQIGLSLPELR